MKVTVTFGDTAVVVPCKPGWTVRDLAEQATRRYRRVSEQNGESSVKTHHLEYTEGGILDMDDLLSDLVEDRDKLVAVFEEVRRGSTDSPRETMSNGFSSADPSAAPSPEPLRYYSHLQNHDPIRGEIEVNEAVLKANTPLLVRSSSDSALAPPLEKTVTPPPSPKLEINDVLKGALDRLHTDTPPAKMSQVNYSTLTKTVEFPGDWGPLGIHVVPYCSSLSGRTLGLHIKGIEESSRAKKEKLFQEDECIVQINDTALQDKTFAQSQEVFRQAMSSPSVRLSVLPMANKPRYEKSLIGQLFSANIKDDPTRTKSPMVVRARTDPQPELKRPETRSRTPDPQPATTNTVDLQSRYDSSERATPSPPMAPASSSSSSSNPRIRSQSPMAGNPVPPAVANLMNKKNSKRLKIDLRKGPEGLGFTVVTRDSSVHGPGPILVKNILPRGAAVKDGRLQPGDCILEVNGVDMTGRSQEELVAMLRSTKQGESVVVVVARQDDMFLPRELKGEEAGGGVVGGGVVGGGGSSVVLEDGREQLMYEIPLNETGSAGLGVSLKGNKSRETGEDLGIFIKSIIHGGAAYKDGRLSVNDQMIAVNGESLLGRSNHAAMETLRRSMSSEGNSRGTIQLVVLRAPRQIGSGVPAPNMATNGPTTTNHQPNTQEHRGHGSYQQGPPSSRPPHAEAPANGTAHTPYAGGSAVYPAAHTNGSYGHYGNNWEEEEEEEDEERGEVKMKMKEEMEESFPLPPSPGSMDELSRDLPRSSPHHSQFEKTPPRRDDVYRDVQLHNYNDNAPRNRASKSMDLVADESNMGSLVRHRDELSGGVTGPTLGLWKSSSLESLQTAVSEAKQSRIQDPVPFHRPRPHMVRGRGANQSFRIAIDKSYDGPSEDDDDLSEQSSGHETPASSSSRQGLDVDDGKKKKKTKGKKKEKKSKGKKKTDDGVEDGDKKSKKKGFNLLRFGKKKDDKNKDTKGSKSKLDALSEEELDRVPDQRDSYEPRYAEIQSGHLTPVSLPDVEDDDSDPNYARINNFREPPSPQPLVSRTPSPLAPTSGAYHPQAAEDLDGLYAKVNKTRPPPQTQVDSDHRLQGLRREYQQARAAPGYEELEAARRKVLDYDPHRVAPRGAESRPVHRYEDVDRQYGTQPRRDPYDYPTHSRPGLREPPAPYPGPPVPSHQGRLPIPQQVPPNQQGYYPPSPRTNQQHRAAVRQDVPPSPSTTRRGNQQYEGRRDGYRHASPGRYTSPERNPVGRDRYASPDRYGYGDERQPDPRRKNPLIGAV